MGVNDEFNRRLRSSRPKPRFRFTGEPDRQPPAERFDYGAGHRVTHVLHLILSIITFGLWLIVWILMGVFGGEKRAMVTVDEYGNVRTGWRLGDKFLAEALSTQATPALAFSPDGNALATLGIGNGVLIWDVRKSSWRRHACRLANRSLTRAEWSRIAGSIPYVKTCAVP